MKAIVRASPALAAAVFLGMYWVSPEYAQVTKTARECAVGLVIFAAVLASLFLCAITRTRSSKKKKQQGGYGYAPRARTGRS